jgi:DNA-binding transcriptional MerR regulator
MSSEKKPLPAIPAKRYFTIGEVSELCGVKAYVLRYWEQEFTQLKPMKRRGNRRYYQHHEVLLIRRIRDLLYEQGFTISGARNQLSDAPHAHVPTGDAGPGPADDESDTDRRGGVRKPSSIAEAQALDEAALDALAQADVATIAQAGLDPAEVPVPKAPATAAERARPPAGTARATAPLEAADTLPNLREELLAIRALLVG